MAVTFKVELLADPGRDGGAAFLELKNLLDLAIWGVIQFWEKKQYSVDLKSNQLNPDFLKVIFQMVRFLNGH